jgi:predicted AAA+ superfamily ATPase
MEFERLLMRRLPELAALSPVLVLTGARQSGKTTLLRRIFPNHRYLSLDLPASRSKPSEAPINSSPPTPGRPTGRGS